MENCTHDYLKKYQKHTENQTFPEEGILPDDYIQKLFYSGNEGVKFSVSMGKIFFDKNQICIIVLSKISGFLLSNYLSDNSIAHSTQVILEF